MKAVTPLRVFGFLIAVLMVACTSGTGATSSSPLPAGSTPVITTATGPSPTGPPADQPGPKDIFADVHGWIAYGPSYGSGSSYEREGIWAVDPTQPGDPEDQIRLSPEGEPMAWSNDGSKLLFRRKVPDPGGALVGFGFDFFILNTDGTETHLTSSAFQWTTGGSFSPDGSQVVYATFGPSHIYNIDAEGGTPQLLLAFGLQAYPDGSPSEVYAPVFSPNGERIAYFDGMGDWGHTLWVMNADGSDPRVLVDDPVLQGASHIGHLIWSPDGTRLAFNFEEGGIWVVGEDGSGLTLIIPDGMAPYWSPDGSRISYHRLTGARFGTLEIADPDGTHVQKFDYAQSGPWNPR